MKCHWANYWIEDKLQRLQLLKDLSSQINYHIKILLNQCSHQPVYKVEKKRWILTINGRLVSNILSCYDEGWALSWWQFHSSHSEDNRPLIIPFCVVSDLTADSTLTGYKNKNESDEVKHHSQSELLVDPQITQYNFGQKMQFDWFAIEYQNRQVVYSEVV